MKPYKRERFDLAENAKSRQKGLLGGFNLSRGKH